MMTAPDRPLLPRAILWARSFLFWIVFMTSTIVLAFPVILAALFSKPLTIKVVDWWVKINLRALELICKLKHRIEGEDNIPDEPTIVFSKHQSTWETLFLQHRFPGILFVAKRELRWIPFFGWALGMLDYILIDRSSGRKAVRQMVVQYRDRKARGCWLAIFPEGTRRPVGAPPDYKIGGAIVAEETGTPLLPVALNAGEFWPRHSFIKWPGEITIVFGPVIRPEGKTADAIKREAQEWIEGCMSEITVIDRFPY